MLQWTLQSNVADVLSLGPRTAGRLMQVGVRSVADLLATKPQVVARRLDDERFDAEIIEFWQREAQLILAAPALPVQAVRTLAAIGYHSPERIARSTPTELLGAIEVKIGEGSGAVWLKKNSQPSVSELVAWIHCAQKFYDPRAA